MVAITTHLITGDGHPTPRFRCTADLVITAPISTPIIFQSGIPIVVTVITVATIGAITAVGPADLIIGIIGVTAIDGITVAVTAHMAAMADMPTEIVMGDREITGDIHPDTPGLTTATAGGEIDQVTMDLIVADLTGAVLTEAEADLAMSDQVVAGLEMMGRVDLEMVIGLYKTAMSEVVIAVATPVQVAIVQIIPAHQRGPEVLVIPILSSETAHPSSLAGVTLNGKTIA